METLEIHSKSFLIKWANAPDNSVVTWQIKPSKKSINFGLFKLSNERLAQSSADDFNKPSTSRRLSSSAGISGSIEERLNRSGLTCVIWHGKCLPDEYLRGHYDVEAGNSGMFALVFDNTFSKTLAKTVLFSQHVLHRDRLNSTTSLQSFDFNGGRSSVSGLESDKSPKKVSSTASFTGNPHNTSYINNDGRKNSASAAKGVTLITAPAEHKGDDGSAAATCVSDGRYITGVLLKKRRKKMQGYARRYFSLDYKYGLLNYYLHQRSSLLRGSMPIKICAVSVREHNRDIFVDSGMEVWSLKALNNQDFKAWVAALEVARTGSSLAGQDPSIFGSAAFANPFPISPTAVPGEPLPAAYDGATGSSSNDSEDWQKLEGLVSRLEKVTFQTGGTWSNNNSDIDLSQPTLTSQGQNLPSRRPSFWKRKSSKQSSTQNLLEDSVEPLDNTVAVAAASNENLPNQVISSNNEAEHIVREMRSLILTHNQNQASKLQVYQQTLDSNRLSYSGSIISEEMFFDANEAFDHEGVVYVADFEDEEFEEVEYVSDAADSTDDELEHEKTISAPIFRPSSEFGGVAKQPETIDLSPLPIDKRITRRTDVPPAVANPPSLISFVRKNVGKDLSTIAMPVTANEPLGLLQRFSELLEYSDLVDEAFDHHEKDPVKALLLITAFAVSYQSSGRAKERSMRKPFNSLLGETFELVREDRGYRMIAEKVSHRPPVIAFQAESSKWTINFTISPFQKFWGKSAEVNSLGSLRLVFNGTGQGYEWSQPTGFLRNVLAGEKYSEPVGSMTIFSSNGSKSVVEFKAGGMFSGRSEDLIATLFDRSGKAVNDKLEGKWTERLYVSNGAGKKDVVWEVGSLVDRYQKKYGFTTFASSLNEVTEIEKGHMSPTDSRLRPDQRLYEQGKTDKAETIKLDLEEKQRQRRKVMENADQVWKPVFFTKDESSSKEFDSYVLKSGESNYWTRRKKADWNGLTELW